MHMIFKLMDRFNDNILTVNRLVNFRWWILLVFLAGYLLTIAKFDEYQGEYFLYSALSLSVCALLLVRLAHGSVDNLAIWVALFIILATQYIRFYWLLLDASYFQNMLTLSGLQALQKGSAQIAGFRMLTLMFVVFCIATFFLIRRCNIGKSTDHVQRLLILGDMANQRIAVILLSLSLFLISILGYIALEYHIGQMGYKTIEVLPYRMAGVIHYSRQVLIPGLLLLAIVVAHRAQRQDLVRLGLFLLLVHGISDVVVRSSRGALLLVLLNIFFLALVNGFMFRKVEKYIVSIAGVLALIAIPITHQYRVVRNSGLDLYQAIKEIRVMHWDLSRYFLEAIEFVYFRIPGIEMPIAIIGVGGQPLGNSAFTVLSTPNGLADYLTYTVLAFPAGAPNSFAPSFLGWFYLVGGTGVLAIAGALLSFTVSAVWARIARLPMYTMPVAQSFFLLLLFLAMTEGTLDVLRYQAMAMLFTVVFFEMLFRLGVRFSNSQMEKRI